MYDKFCGIILLKRVNYDKERKNGNYQIQDFCGSNK